MPRKMKGYENYEIIGYSEKEVLEIVNSGTNAELLEVAGRTQEFLHHSDDRTRKTKSYAVASEWRDKLEVMVANLLRNKGYTIQTQEDYKKGINHKNTDIHLTFGDLCYSEHPTRTETNFSVKKLICDKKGEFISKEELEKKLYKSRKVKAICQDEFDELDEADKKLVNEFMVSEGITLEDIHAIEEDDSFELDQIRIEVGNREYYIIRDDSNIDSIMRRYLEEDSEYEYFYTQGIEAKQIDPIHTCYSDWLDLVIQDGWESIVGTYDGSSTPLSGNAVYYRRN